LFLLEKNIWVCTNATIGILGYPTGMSMIQKFIFM